MTQILYLAFSAVLFFAFVIGILNFLPTGTELPTGISSAITLIFGYMQLFNFFLPIDTLMQVLAATLLFQGAILLWAIIRWVIAFISTWMS